MGLEVEYFQRASCDKCGEMGKRVIKLIWRTPLTTYHTGRINIEFFICIPCLQEMIDADKSGMGHGYKKTEKL